MKDYNEERQCDENRDVWCLRLYIAGQSPRSTAALLNLRMICKECLSGRCDIEVIDLLEDPQRAKGDQILAIPTVVRLFPFPIRKLIGDLSNREHVLKGLDMSHGAVM